MKKQNKMRYQTLLSGWFVFGVLLFFTGWFAYVVPNKARFIREGNGIPKLIIFAVLVIIFSLILDLICYYVIFPMFFAKERKAQKKVSQMIQREEGVSMEAVAVLEQALRESKSTTYQTAFRIDLAELYLGMKDYEKATYMLREVALGDMTQMKQYEAYQYEWMRYYYVKLSLAIEKNDKDEVNLTYQSGREYLNHYLQDPFVGPSLWLLYANYEHYVGNKEKALDMLMDMPYENQEVVELARKLQMVECLISLQRIEEARTLIKELLPKIKNEYVRRDVESLKVRIENMKTSE